MWSERVAGSSLLIEGVLGFDQAAELNLHCHKHQAIWACVLSGGGGRSKGRICPILTNNKCGPVVTSARSDSQLYPDSLQSLI